ncbi:MAG: family 16 glycosylhydrolase [Gammaproteobacteria bacterium]|nr:family 16 glycosylhydrolase [Gammaproteobacteria bacterium]MDH5653287.1 family 16 glycosylhydrolase [Gammaproteobacteria bacterium]
MGRVNYRESISQKPRLFYLPLALVAGAAIIPVAQAAESSPWKTVYQDSYNYSQQLPESTTFNTWFWREDSAASHEFEVTSGAGCSVQTPCVKLTAHAYPASTKYTNAEMYNNSCIKDTGTGSAAQQLATLKNSVWGRPLYHRIVAACDIPYPYQATGSYLYPFGLTSSWTNTSPAHLDENHLALTASDQEAEWKAIRDITFNNPYRSDTSTAIRLTTQIRAETNDQGGSRGWGFWNTTLDSGFLQLAWFMEYSVPQAYVQKKKRNRSVVMQTIGRSENGKSFKICSTVLSKPDIYDWHTYRIEWRDNAVRYFVDDKLVADHRDIKLDKHLAFHNWVDNRNYVALDAMVPNFPLTRDKTNYIKSFLVESASTASLTPLSGSGTGKCQILSINKLSLLGDILKLLAKDYLK